MNIDCRNCKFLMGHCFKHRPKETEEERAERARATKHTDTKKIREQASKLWDKNNGKNN